MSAKSTHITVAIEHFAITQLALMIVNVSKDSKEMECHVKMSMSAALTSRIAAFMRTAITLLGPTSVLVTKDSKAMDDHAMT